MGGTGLATAGLAMAGLVAAALVSTGCLSPTLPLPPPSRPDITPPDARGFVSLTGRVPGGTTALAQNQANGKLVGQVTDDSGFYVLEISAAVGDRIAIWYRDVYRDSGSIVVVVPDDDGGVSVGGAAGATSE